MRESVKNIFAGIGMVAVVVVAGLSVANFAQSASVAAEDETSEIEYQQDIDPQLAHYRSQYYQLLADYSDLQEQNDLLQMQIQCDANNIALLEKALSEPDYDLDNDGLVTICDAVKLMRFLAEMEG